MAQQQSGRFAVEKAPADTVAELEFKKDSTILMAASWDNTLRFWKSENQFTSVDVLDPVVGPEKDAIVRCAFGNDNDVYYGTALGQVKKVVLGTGKSEGIGNHDGVVSGVKWMADRSLLVTAGTDRQMALYDPRGEPGTVVYHKIPAQCVAVDISGNTIGLIMVGRGRSKYEMKDVRNLERCQMHVPIPHPAVLTSIAMCDEDARWSLVGSTCGAVLVELSDPANEIKQNMWYPHIKDQICYASNTVKFARAENGRIIGGMSAGSDGLLATYSMTHKTHVLRPPITEYLAPLTALATSNNGIYAVATGNDWSQGQADQRKIPVKIILGKHAEVDFT